MCLLLDRGEPLPRPRAPEASSRGTFPAGHPLLGRGVLLDAAVISKSPFAKVTRECQLSCGSTAVVNGLVEEEDRMKSIGRLVCLVWGTFRRNFGDLTEFHGCSSEFLYRDPSSGKRRVSRIRFCQDAVNARKKKHQRET